MAFITRLFKSSKHTLLILPLLLLISFQTAAEGINTTRAQAKLTGSGQLSISSRFQTDLPGQLKLPELGQMQLAIASSFIGTLVRHMEQTFGFAVSAMANKAVLAGVEYLSAYAAAIGEPA